MELLVDVKGDVTDYDHWMPEGSLADPDKPGNSVSVKATLVDKKDHNRPAKQPATAFVFELADVSQEPGVCMNWPPPGKKQPTNPDDLQFVAKLQHTAVAPESTPRRLVLSKSGTEATALLHSFDFGAYGVLGVKAILEDGCDRAKW